MNRLAHIDGREPFVCNRFTPADDDVGNLKDYFLLLTTGQAERIDSLRQPSKGELAAPPNGPFVFDIVRATI